MKSICLVTAVPATVNSFLLSHIEVLSKSYTVTVVSSFDGTEKIHFPQSVKIITIDIAREISFFRDISSLVKLFVFFKTHKFDLVLSVTPKAGLLSSIAGFFARTKTRIHWFTGQVWVTKKGISRKLLKFIDKCMAFFLTSALVDSHSQLDFLVKNAILNAKKASVLGCGSISGVSLTRFSFKQAVRDELRHSLAIPSSDKVIIFLGRLNTDKGVVDLVNAFRLINADYEKVHLVLVGPDEEFIQKQVLDTFGNLSRLHFVGHTSEPERWLCVADVFCLPSYREGFGTSVIEAASIGIPAVVSNIYGLTDAVLKDETGLFFEPGDIESLAKCIVELIDNEIFLLKLSQNAKDRVQKNFSDAYISELLDKYISERLIN